MKIRVVAALVVIITSFMLCCCYIAGPLASLCYIAWLSGSAGWPSCQTTPSSEKVGHQ